jgi:outer membrane protein insertion porin family
MLWITVAVALLAAQPQKAPDRVGRIIIHGNTQTRDRIILRQLEMSPGQVLNYPQVKAAEGKLRKLGLFDEATVEVRPNDSGREFKDVVVEVQERPWNWLLFGIEDLFVGVATLDTYLLWDAACRFRFRH